MVYIGDHLAFFFGKYIQYIHKRGRLKISLGFEKLKYEFIMTFNLEMNDGCTM